MAFLSANDDFRSRTLTGVDGMLRRLAYIVGLRDGAGQYKHWGLLRTYGPENAQQAVAANHSEAWMEVLRTPLPELVSEVANMDEKQRGELLARLDGLSEVTCPANPRGGTIRHFNSTVLALRLLCRERDAKTAS